MTETNAPPALSPSPPMLLRVERADCLRLDSALTREWLETDGLGGYASSTILLAPTRRYHGLLVSTPPGHVRRHVFLARLEESLHRPERSFAFSNARYSGAWFPSGYGSIESFSLAPWPTWVYRMGRTEVRREVLLVRGSPTVLVRYSLESPREDIEIRLRPLLAFREADALTHENLGLQPRVEREGGAVRCRPYAALPPMWIAVQGIDAPEGFEADPLWFRRVEYRADLARGYDGHEDHFSPGWFHAPFVPGTSIVLAATLEDRVPDPAALYAREAARRRASAPAEGDLPGRLSLAAESHLYRTPSGRTGVQAGFPWFGEWGRDTLISLPGLLLARDRVAECGEALAGLLPFLRDGLLPNIFASGDGAAASESGHYNSADASLWFAWAVRQFQNAGGSRAMLLEHFRPALEEIARRYRDGTGCAISATSEGLLRAGSPQTNVTWMDAVTRNGAVTPRDGLAVDLNALWYFLLAYVEDLAGEAGDRAAAKSWGALRRKARGAFLDAFWIPHEDYLADVVRDGRQDRAVRPNMVIAAALELSPLGRPQRAEVVRRAEAELLTPFGIRTLSPKHPLYRGRYQGGPEERDEAYHQGTVWPWLVGFYVEATLRAFGRGRKTLAALRALLEGFRPQLLEAGLNHLSEVHEGDPPHAPGGTIAQAWSIAEWLRAWRMVEEGRP